jgi:hypothetical protein
MRVLGAAIRGAVPDGVAGAVSAAVAGVLTPLGPIGAGLTAVTANAAKSLTDSAVGQKGKTDDGQGADEPGDADDGTLRELPRLDLTAITGEEGKADPFLNSFLAEDLKLVAEALRAGNAGRALASYLTPEDRVRTTRRKDVRHDPGHVLGSCRPDLIPAGRWVTATDRPLAFSQQFAVNRIMRDHGDGQR